MKTIAEISDLLGVPSWRVSYAIRQREIFPVKRIGCTRVFADSVVELLRPDLLASTAREMRRLPSVGQVQTSY